MSEQTEWLETEILRGLQRLACLSLDRTPAAEMLPGTAQAWIAALTHGKAWDRDLDTPRIRHAFVVVSATARRWPAPAEFLEAVPRHREQLALTKQHIPADPAKAEAAIAEIEALLRGKAAAAEQGGAT